MWRPGHVPDAAVTALQQMIGHQAAGLQIIHHHVIGLEIGEVAQEQNKRDPGSLQESDVAAVRLGRRQDQPVDLLRLQHGQATQRLFLIFGRVAQEQTIADRMGRALDRMHDGGVDRAGAVGDDQAEGLGCARRQCLRHRTGHVVQPFGNRQDSGSRFGTELTLVVQGVRYGGVRDPASLATSWMVTGTVATSDLGRRRRRCSVSDAHANAHGNGSLTHVVGHVKRERGIQIEDMLSQESKYSANRCHLR